MNDFPFVVFQDTRFESAVGGRLEANEPKDLDQWFLFADEVLDVRRHFISVQTMKEILFDFQSFLERVHHGDLFDQFGN